MSSKYLNQEDLDQKNVNPNYAAWIDDDNTLILWLQSIISDAVIPYVVGADSSRDLCLNIDSRFARTSTAHSIQLRTKLQSLKLGSRTITQFLGEIKKLSDQLSTAGSPVSDDELIVLILNGIGTDYAFSTSIHVRNPPVSFDELHNLLLSEEIIVNERSKNLVTRQTTKFFKLSNLNRHS
ncbi:uncharacterized protein LOC113313034 [Papaver somniferum]|uniref:uncharacterized protein LOC113313034 n=1 Tax=Papaver somniferum TaxID=3469 RepID=UPI000E70087F|nr:uncharacterized protein LOC113313034 [Papaver somniferum]